MVEPLRPRFTWNEVWLLLSVSLGGGANGASLRDILATGDYINHAIFTADDLRRGFAKLICAGHVVDVAGRYYLSRPVQEFWDRLSLSTRSMQRRIRGFETFLGVDPHDGPLSPEQDSAWSHAALTDEMWSVARQEYLEGARIRS